MKISLHRRLVSILLGLITFTWLTTAALLYFSPGKALEEVMDQQLAQYSHVVTYISRVFAQQIDEGLPLYEAWREYDLEELKKRPLVVEGLEGAQLSPAVNVWLSGRLIGLIEDSPRFPHPEIEGYQYLEGPNGNRWRIHAHYDALSELWILVGVDFEARKAQVLGTFARTMMPALVVIPLTLLVLLWGVPRGLQPLRALAQQIGRRRPGQLHPVDTTDVPEELSEVVGATNHLMERLASALESEQRFTANAAHELRTPLAAIKTEVQLCQKQIKDDPGQAMLGRIARRVDRASHTVEQLLTLARVDPEAELAREAVALRTLLSETLADTAHIAAERGIGVDLDEDPEVLVQGNGEALAICVQNLLVNAFRYALEESVVQLQLHAGEHVAILEISNDCAPLSDSEFEQIRDRFYRVPGSQGEGSGLGLSIVERIAELHGGIFSAQPRREDGGFCARLELPL